MPSGAATNLPGMYARPCHKYGIIMYAAALIAGPQAYSRTSMIRHTNGSALKLGV